MLTAVAPFAFTSLALRVISTGHIARLLIGLLIGLIVCVAGYALFWKLFIAASEGAPRVEAVAVRGVGWGLAQGATAVMVRR